MNSQIGTVFNGRGDMTGVGTSPMLHSPTRMVPAKDLEMIRGKRIVHARQGNPPGMSTAHKAVKITAKYWRAWRGAFNRQKMKLYKAVASGELDNFDELYKPNWLPKFSQGNTILHVAIQHRQRDMATKILERELTLLDGSNSNGDTPLHIAARIWDLDLVVLLLTSRNHTSEEVDAVQRLLEMTNKEGDTALHDAIRNRAVTVVEFLLKARPELTLTVNRAGESPLFVAVDYCFLEAARKILQIPGISPSFKGRDSMNALHAAIIRFGDRDHTRRSGPQTDPRICNDFVNELITGRPSAMSEFDKFGRTPFHYAAQFGCDEVAMLLSKLDIDLARIPDRDGMSALHIAAKNGHYKFIRKLLNYCPDIFDLLDNKDMTAIHAAVESKKRRVVEYFLESKLFQGVINGKDKNGNTPLHLAAIHEDPYIFLRLIKHGRVDRSAINKEGFTAMDIIRSNRELPIYEKDIMFESQLCMTGSLPRSLKQVSRTYVPEHTTGKPIVQDIRGIDTEHNISTGDFENGATAGDMVIGDIDIAGNDRYVWRGRYMEDIDVVVATLIAAVTYQAALQTPGGYTQDEIHKGTAVLIKAFAFNVFVIADSLAFSLASASIFVHFWSSIEESHTVVTKLRHYARLMTNISIVGMVVAFAAGASVVLTPSPLLHAFIIVCCTCFFLGPIVFFLRIMRATINSVLSGIVEKFRRARHYPVPNEDDLEIEQGLPFGVLCTSAHYPVPSEDDLEIEEGLRYGGVCASASASARARARRRRSRD